MRGKHWKAPGYGKHSKVRGLKKNSKLLKDILWYLLGFIIPTLISFIKNPVFTRYFTPEEYGYLSIVNTTLSFVSIIVYSWISSCMYRFYNRYKNDKKLNLLFSNIIFLYLVSSGITVFSCIVWTSFYANSLIKTLIILNALEIILSQILSIYMISIRLEGKAIKYNLMNVVTSLLSFLLLLYLTFKLQYRIDALIHSRLVIDFLLIIYIALCSLKKLKISLRYVSKVIIKKLLRYGYQAVFCNVCLLLLTSGDRYIIGLYGSMDSVGIYNQIYNISEISIVALISIYANSINPILYRELEENFDNYGVTLDKYTNLYIYLLLPLTVYFSLFSKQISTLLLGEKFRVGFKMMPYVIGAAFIYGIVGLMQDVFRFSSKLNILIKGFILAALTNIILNLLLIPVFNYQVAAVTTLISYIILYLYYYYYIPAKFFNNKGNIKTILPVVYILLTQVAVDLIIRLVFKIELDVVNTIFEGFIFLSSYVLCLRKQIKGLLKPDKYDLKQEAV